MPNLFRQNFGGLCIDQCFLMWKFATWKQKSVSANLTKGFLRKNPTKLPYFEEFFFWPYFDNKFNVLPTHGKNLNFFLMFSLTCNQIQLKYLVEGHQPTHLTKMKKKSLVLTPFLLKNGKKGKKKRNVAKVCHLSPTTCTHIKKEKKGREFWKNQLPNLILNSAYQNVLHLGHKAITQLQGTLSIWLLWF